MEDSNYHPAPIASSQIELDELEPLIERLAKNAHEVWAEQRMSEGWTLGVERDDQGKKHPLLIPYEDLPQIERAIDRAIVAQTLAAAIALGYDIRRTNTYKDEASLPAMGHPLAGDDMDDTREIEFYRQQVANGNSSVRPVLDRLELIQQIIHPAFRKADKAAISYQREYESKSFRSVLAGGVTVGLGLLQLSKLVGSPESPWLPLLELVTGALTIYFILIAKAERYKENWLLGRFKAEKLRLLKFRCLSNLSFWEEHSPNVAAQMTESVHEIQAYAYPAVEEWVSHSVMPETFSHSDSTRFPLCWSEFVAYYRSKRLYAQMNYLERQETVLERSESRSVVLGSAFFFGSVAFVLAHVALHFGAKEVNESWSNGLIALAAALPAAAALVRTYRSAREFGRNANRHLATRSTLQEISQRLHDRPSSSDSYRDIGLCELVFEGDSREWLRLMKEAEWFG